jgi:hypothetical protein
MGVANMAIQSLASRIITRTHAGGQRRPQEMLTALWQLASVQHRVDVLRYCAYRYLASVEHGLQTAMKG